MLCLYLMGLNLSNRQIAQELGLSVSDVQVMTEHLRTGLVAKAPAVVLEGTVEVDEVHVVAGHKGHPAAVAKKGAWGGGDGALLRYWSHLPEWPQMLLRAVLFRLAWHALHPRSGVSTLDGLRRAAGEITELL